MTPTLLRLEDGVREYEVWRLSPLRTDVIVTKLEVSSPSVREVVEDHTDDDGTDDDTTRSGAGTVSLELSLFDRPQQLLAELKPFLRPGRRPWLVLDDDEWDGPRRIRLRADPWSAPLPWQGLGRWLEVQLQWKAPGGFWEAVAPVELEVRAATPVREGLAFPSAFPWVFPPTSPAGAMTHDNPGVEDAHQVVRLYGPAAGPRWTCDTTGESLVFNETLVLGAGEFVEIDTAAQTVLANGEPDASRVSHLDYPASTWWKVPPGISQLRYHPVSGAQAGCAALATYRPRY